jgi:hypothetical protein
MEDLVADFIFNEGQDSDFWKAIHAEAIEIWISVWFNGFNLSRIQN